MPSRDSYALSTEVRRQLGVQMGKLAVRLLDGMYQDEIAQLRVASKAFEQLIGHDFRLGSARGQGDASVAQIVGIGASLATDESRVVTYEVTLSNGTEAVLQIHGRDEGPGKFQYLRPQ